MTIFFLINKTESLNNGCTKSIYLNISPPYSKTIAFFESKGNKSLIFLQALYNLEILIVSFSSYTFLI